jgi:hypothetical protein
VLAARVSSMRLTSVFCGAPTGFALEGGSVSCVH